jgi:hypothetical protein
MKRIESANGKTANVIRLVAGIALALSGAAMAKAASPEIRRSRKPGGSPVAMSSATEGWKYFPIRRVSRLEAGRGDRLGLKGSTFARLWTYIAGQWGICELANTSRGGSSGSGSRLLRLASWAPAGRAPADIGSGERGAAAAARAVAPGFPAM